MTTAIALLRAVNVSGTKLAMSELRAVGVELGFSHVRTVLQTGNLVFETDRPVDTELELHLESALAQRFGFKVEIVTRTAADWRATLADNPFPREAESDPDHLVVITLKGVPETAGMEALRRSIKGRERVAAVRDSLFAVYPDGIGRSKLTLARIERTLGLRGTGRNWNTAMKLMAMTGG